MTNALALVRLTGVTSGEVRAVSRVAGVTQATAVYTASSTCSLAVNLVTGGPDQPCRSAWRS